MDEDLIIVEDEDYVIAEKWYRKLFMRMSNHFSRLTFILGDEEMIYFLLFINLAFFGFFNRFLIAAQLIDVFWRFPTLGNVIDVFTTLYCSLFGDPRNRSYLLCSSSWWFSIISRWLFSSSLGLITA